MNIGEVTVIDKEGLISSELSNFLELALRIPTYTTAQLTSIDSIANRDKRQGLQVYNSTTNRTLWAGGNDRNSAWVDGANLPVHMVS